VPVVPVGDEADELGIVPLARQPVTVMVPAALALDVALDVDGVCVAEPDDDGACANTPATENAAAIATAPVQVFHCCMSSSSIQSVARLAAKTAPQKTVGLSVLCHGDVLLSITCGWR
jgi:hypothetical protein